MPLTRFQKEILALLAPNRSPESYMAGGTALHFSPNSIRYSRDFDVFRDSESLVAEAFARDRETLEAAEYEVEVLISQPGFIRTSVSRTSEATQIDWAHDSAWRFMPVQKDELGGYVLHEIDLATSKILALAGRSETWDLIDALYVTEHVLPLGPLVWAAVEKDPGFSPLSLLEMLKRGRIIANA